MSINQFSRYFYRGFSAGSSAALSTRRVSIVCVLTVLDIQCQDTVVIRPFLIPKNKQRNSIMPFLNKVTNGECVVDCEYQFHVNLLDGGLLN